jgi:hypothetical protein
VEKESRSLNASRARDVNGDAPAWLAVYDRGGASPLAVRDCPHAARTPAHNGRMRLYADLPSVRRRQILGDLFVLGWIVVWIWVGLFLYNLVAFLGVPGELLEDAAQEVAGAFGDVADTLGDAPLLGDALATPFDGAESAVSGIADAGRSQQEAAIRLARWVGVVVAALPIAFALILWLPGRLRWIRASQVASALRSDTALFAVRAIANRPVRELAAIDPAPGSALLRGDARVIEALAALELGAMGVKRPAEAGSAGWKDADH